MFLHFSWATLQFSSLLPASTYHGNPHAGPAQAGPPVLSSAKCLKCSMLCFWCMSYQYFLNRYVLIRLWPPSPRWLNLGLGVIPLLATMRLALHCAHQSPLVSGMSSWAPLWAGAGADAAESGSKSASSWSSHSSNGEKSQASSKLKETVSLLTSFVLTRNCLQSVSFFFFFLYMWVMFRKRMSIIILSQGSVTSDK